MEHKQIYIGAEELIVGEKGPAPKATTHLPGVMLSQPGRSGPAGFPREGAFQGQRPGQTNLSRNHYSLLAGQVDAATSSSMR